ncbi:MAG: DNA polymerase/3'-5' exonuclease PolX [Bacteroidota bacterium]
MTTENNKLASIFHEIASMYKFMGGQSFRAGAYEKVSNSVLELPERISKYVHENRVDEIPGVGESTKHDIVEYTKTGHVSRFDQLKKKIPYGLIELMDISGFGPASLNLLFKKLHITDRAELMTALQDGRVAGLKGFGPRKVENMLRGLKLHKRIEERMLLWDAMQEAERLVKWLTQFPEVKRVEVAGSIRRRKETIGDIDLVAIVNKKDRSKVASYFTDKSVCRKILVKGETRISILTRNLGRQADLRMINESEWGSALLYFTGSREHTIHLRAIAKSSGYKINEYGIFDSSEDMYWAGETEQDMYKALGMQFIPPEMREDRGEIELALKKRIPELVELKDIRGDLHVHSNWSDGSNAIDEIAACVMKNYPYDYIAITDHSKSSRIAGGLNEKEFLKQIKVIRKVNEDLGKDYLKAGAEVDIRPDGSLDLSDELLAQLDWVIASIHSGFKKDNTERLIRACESKYVHCIGHPTGRIIGRRDPYSVDLRAFIKAAYDTKTALEINCQRDRMDMNDEMAWEVREKGIKIVISTDSHKFSDLNWMQLGVGIARRAWCKKENILNTLSWKAVQKYFASP